MLENTDKMKKLIYLIALISIGAFSQNNPAVYRNGIDTKLIALDTLTTAQRDAITLKASKGYVIFNADTNTLNMHNGTSWGEVSGSGATNLSTTQTPTTVTINSDTGTDATILLGDGVDAGVSINDYTNADKALVGSALQPGDLSGYALLGANNNFTGANTFQTGTNSSNITSIYNGNGAGFVSQHSGSGFGFQSLNTGPGIGSQFRNDGSGSETASLWSLTTTGDGIVTEGLTGSTGFPFVVRLDGVNTATFSKEGDLIANSLAITDGLPSQFLKADGSVDTNNYVQSDLTVTTVTTNYSIQLSDIGFDKLLEVNSVSDVTITIPLDSALGLTNDAVFNFKQVNTGGVTVAYSVGVTGDPARTINSGDKITLSRQGSDSWKIFEYPINAGISSGVEIIRHPSTGLSGTSGLRLNKILGATNPIGISFSHDDVMKWDFGLDFDNNDFVPLFNHRVGWSGDIVRFSNNNNMNIGGGIGSPELNDAIWTFQQNNPGNVLGINGLKVLMNASELDRFGFTTNAKIKADNEIISGNAIIKRYFNNSTIAQFVHEDLSASSTLYGVMQGSDGAMYYGGLSHNFENGNVIVPDGTAANEAVNKGQLDASINPNETRVSNLTELQAVVDGTSTITRIVKVIGNIDLVNTDVTLTNVHIVDGGGSIVTSGTGELSLLGNSLVDNSILNYQLNWATATTAKLINCTYIFDKYKYPIEETFVSVAWNNATTIADAQANRDNLQKAVNDVSQLGGEGMFINNLDTYWYTAPLGGVDYASVNITETAGFSIIIPSNFHFKMGDKFVARLHPSDTYSQHFLSISYSPSNLTSAENITIEGGEIYGTRETHNYKQARPITVAEDDTNVLFKIGSDFAEVEYNIPVTASNATAQAQEISDYINNAANGLTALGYSSTYSGTTFYIENSTVGFYFRAYETPGQTFTTNQSKYDITYEFGIAVIGGQNINIRGVKVKNVFGDGVVVAGYGQTVDPNFRNSFGVNIDNCRIENSRRIDYSIIGGENIYVKNCYSLNAGRDSGVNDGAGPARAYHVEPYGEVDSNGDKIDYNLCRNITFINNYAYDSEQTSFSNYTGYDVLFERNYSNRGMEAQFGQRTTFRGNTVDFTTGDGNPVSRLGNQFAFNVSKIVGSYPKTVEKNSTVIFDGNFVIGLGNDATFSMTGIRADGHSIIATNNNIKNVTNGIVATNLVRGKINNNFIYTYPEVLAGNGIAMTSATMESVDIIGNTIKVYSQPLEIVGVNSTGLLDAQLITNPTRLNISGNEMLSYNSLSPRLRAIYNGVTFNHNTVHQRMNFENIVNNADISFNDFKNKLEFNGTGSTLNNVKILNNNIYSLDTSAALEIDIRADSDSVYVANNNIHQTSGLRGIYIWENGGQITNYKVANNILVQGSPTNFIDFFGDNSTIANNVIASNWTLDQSVTGSGNITPILPASTTDGLPQGSTNLYEDKSATIQIACSDLITDITTGASKAYFRMPYGMTLTSVRVSLLTAGASTGITVDINENGTSVLSTLLTTDATEKTSTTATTAAVISDSALADDSEITIDFDAVPTGGKGVVVTLKGTRI